VVAPLSAVEEDDKEKADNVIFYILRDVRALKRVELGEPKVDIGNII